ncbi:MAG TPA: hypothetical protein VIG96_12790 [Blastococcus sp.]
MIMGAALLVLLGLGCFVAGILTGTTWLYWACVASCAVAAVLLVATRRQIATEGAARGAQASSDPAGSVRAAGSRAAADGTAMATPDAGEPAADRRETGVLRSESVPAQAGTLVGQGPHSAPGDLGEPPVEEVEVTDLLMVVDLKDDVLVVDEHPRYHVAGCAHVAGRTTIPLPLDEARADGFTPCAVCAPDRTLAQRARERK